MKIFYSISLLFYVLKTIVCKETFAIVQYDDRLIDENTQFLIDKNKEYCKKYNYEYFFINDKIELPSYWAKVKLANDYLQTGKYNGILFMDSDSTIHNHNITIEEIVIENKSFYMATDRIGWNSPFNAGVFIVLNDQNGKSIMNDWMQLYNIELYKFWEKKNNKWITNGEWAGNFYEQGSFINKILPKYKDSIFTVEWTFFQSVFSDINNNKKFIFHFSGHYKNEIHSYKKEFK
jgi:hypothetical protein